MHTTAAKKNKQPEYIIKTWLKRQLKKEYDIKSLDGDAGSRKYYRIFDKNNESFILAQDSDTSQLMKFINISSLLKHNNINTPEIISYNHEMGVILQKDFGDNLLKNYTGPNYSEKAFHLCINKVLEIQKVSCRDIPEYNFDKLHEETILANTWYFNTFCNFKENIEINNMYEDICERVAKLPKAFVHRDFHSRNIFILENNKVGLIDFQDAVFGPITYDIASLLRDYYNPLEKKELERLLLNYYQKASANGIIELSYEEFIDAFYLTSLQRHLKVLGIFCRLALRDGKSNYLQHIPIVINYISDSVKKHPAYNLILEQVELAYKKARHEQF